MENLALLTSFFGWCTLINCIMYTLGAAALTVFRTPVKRLHAQFTGVAEESLEALYFSFLGNYKLGILLFSFTPYLALKVLSL